MFSFIRVAVVMVSLHSNETQTKIQVWFSIVSGGCRVIGPAFVCFATGLSHSGRQDIGSDHTYPTLSPDRCLALGQPQDTALEMGNRSLKHRTV